MSLLPILLDSQPPFLGGRSSSASLLCLPAGVDTAFHHFSERLKLERYGKFQILALFDPPPSYRQSVEACSEGRESVITAERFGEFVAKQEPSDLLLLLDPTCFPQHGFDVGENLPRRHDYRWAHHFITTHASRRGASEIVELAPDGTIDRVRRSYGGVTRSEAGSVFCTLISAAAAHSVGLKLFRSLSDLRRAVAGASTFSRDIPIAAPAYDLSSESGYLGFTEQLVHELVGRSADRGYTHREVDVWVGPGAFVHASARVLGPVVVQRGARIEAGACVVGPAVLGAESRVRKGAVVAHAVVASGAVVPVGAEVTRRVWTDVRGSSVPDLERKRSASSSGARAAGSRNKWNERAAADLPPDADAAEFEFVSGYATRPLRDEDHGRGPYPELKRWAEALLAAVGLLVLFPVFFGVAILLKLSSRGPILFAHEREGLNGRVFKCWKFRTMVDGAHTMQRALYASNRVDGPQFKLEKDARITRMGRWLRNTNLDELPQLINVLSGEMSLIGPRPSPFRENQICVPWRVARLSLRPGITGLWQLCRSRRSSGDFHQWIYYDLLYVRHMSWQLDAKILLATILTLGGRWPVPVSWIVPPQILYEGDAAVDDVVLSREAPLGRAAQ